MRGLFLKKAVSYFLTNETTSMLWSDTACTLRAARGGGRTIAHHSHCSQSCFDDLQGLSIRPFSSASIE